METLATALLGALCGAIGASAVQVMLQNRMRHTQRQQLAAALASEVLLMAREVRDLGQKWVNVDEWRAEHLPRSLEEKFKSFFESNASAAGSLDRPVLLSTMKAYWQQHGLGAELKRDAPGTTTDDTQKKMEMLGKMQRQQDYLCALLPHLNGLAKESFRDRGKRIIRERVTAAIKGVPEPDEAVPNNSG